MNREKTINILRIVFIAVVFTMAVFVYLNPPKTETNILRAILSNSNTDEILVTLSEKHSGRLNVIFEADEPEKISAAKNDFLEITEI